MKCVCVVRLSTKEQIEANNQNPSLWLEQKGVGRATS